MVEGLDYMSSAGLRVLVFASQKMDAGVDIFVVGARHNILLPIKQTGLHHCLSLLETYDPEVVEKI
jgi:anti-sigma B factor antagonist